MSFDQEYRVRPPKYVAEPVSCISVDNQSQLSNEVVKASAQFQQLATEQTVRKSAVAIRDVVSPLASPTKQHLSATAANTRASKQGVAIAPPMASKHDLLNLKLESINALPQLTHAFKECVNLTHIKPAVQMLMINEVNNLAASYERAATTPHGRTLISATTRSPLELVQARCLSMLDQAGIASAFQSSIAAYTCTRLNIQLNNTSTHFVKGRGFEGSSLIVTAKDNQGRKLEIKIDAAKDETSLAEIGVDISGFKGTQCEEYFDGLAEHLRKTTGINISESSRRIPKIKLAPPATHKPKSTAPARKRNNRSKLQGGIK